MNEASLMFEDESCHTNAGCIDWSNANDTQIAPGAEKGTTEKLSLSLVIRKSGSV
jgi:hypothetical protein